MDALLGLVGMDFDTFLRILGTATLFLGFPVALIFAVDGFLVRHFAAKLEAELAATAE